MAINIFETPIMPSVDLDNDVIVYVPGYAIKGPDEPTLVTSSNFTTLFGDRPYTFKNAQTCSSVDKNNILKGKYEKSWLYAKGLVDAGLTVLFHRLSVTTAATYAKCANAINIKDDTVDTELSFYVRSKYKGSYYNGLAVKFTERPQGLFLVEIAKSKTLLDLGKLLESKNVSLDPSSPLYLGNTKFSNVEFTADLTGNLQFDTLDIEGYLADHPDAKLKLAYTGDTKPVDIELVLTESDQDEFDVNSFLTKLSGTESSFNFLKDYDNYTVTYITSGGYFQTADLAGKMMSIAKDIKAVALIDLPDDITEETVGTKREGFAASLTTTDALDKSFGALFVGCDTFIIDSIKVVLGDSFGYLTKLGGNIQAGIPEYLPVANNLQGNVSLGVAATRPVSKVLSEMMIDEVGCSINPIVYKKNIGYVIMGNRTLYPNSGILGPQSFLNCRLVVNKVERASRKAASSLVIVSTNPETAFKKFRAQVEPTLDRMLTNGDGLNSYKITKLKKTKPATIDIEINLVVVEGIETFNIYIPYSINLD